MKPMFIFFSISLTLAFPLLPAQLPDSAGIDVKGNSIILKNARFQFLTPTLMRMEFSASGEFTDGPTVVVLNREWPQVKFTTDVKEGWITATTGKLALRYHLNSGKLTRDNFEMFWEDSVGKHTWAPGDSDKGNLGGITYSLDGASKRRLPQFSSGLLSRSGYFVLDDSKSAVWSKDSNWIVPRPEKDEQDLYFFVYGEDYAGVLREYTGLCGKIPMIPRYTLGAWITDLNYEYLPDAEDVRKFHYTDKDVRKLVERFQYERIPLDILVLDFAWHRLGWQGSYDWSPIFPKPVEFLDWARRNGLKISLNDHPGYGKESVLSDLDSRAGVVRERLNMPLSPPSKFSLDIAKGWFFQVDPENNGVSQRWFVGDVEESRWKTVQLPALWENQGYPNYDGVGWYRKWVSIPKEIPHPFYLIFGGVDDEYDLYINGEKIVHHGSPGSSVYNSLTYTDIAPYMKPGTNNLITLRVNDWGGGGGIGKGPVVLADRPPAAGIRFNLANKLHAEVFMDVLHNPLIDQGVDFWWVDGGSGSCEMEGLNSQMWTNRVFYDFTEQHTGKRGFIFSRYGGWGNHRYPSFFTGDTYSDWEVLAYQVPFTAKGGNVLMPYITHDIGGFLGRKISFEMYARWVEFGTFSPFLRLHSAFENPSIGNLRMPWTYGREGIELAQKYFRLRNSLIPYIYTYSRIAHDEALPILRPLYLEFPGIEQAYRFPGEYLFGREFLVAPVVDSTSEKEVYFPPGQWTDYFTGKRYQGDQVLRVSCPVETIPLFVRDGSIIPLQPDMSFSDERPLDTLILDVYPGDSAQFNFYEDDGLSLDYRSGKYAWTPISYLAEARQTSRLVIGPVKGEFSGQVQKRAYKVKIHNLQKPQSIVINGRPLEEVKGNREGWMWEGEKAFLSIAVEAVSIRDTVKILIE